MPQQFESLSYTNQFQFQCPIFNSKTRMGACVQLRDMVWKGLNTPLRKGCQAAMKCGKCPAADMVRRYCYNDSWVNDHHGSATPVEGKLMLPILERIRPVMMQESIMVHYGVSAAERALLETANERIDAMMKTAPGEPTYRVTVTSGASATKRRSTSRKKEEVVETPVDTANDSITNAAMSGDMAAAINAQGNV